MDIILTSKKLLGVGLLSLGLALPAVGHAYYRDGAGAGVYVGPVGVGVSAGVGADRCYVHGHSYWKHGHKHYTHGYYRHC